MAASVFGTPITDETLKGLPKYHDNTEITRKDRAQVAFMMKNAEGKDLNAQQYLENVRARTVIDDKGRYTKCLIYNATGDPIVFVTARSWKGALQETPYPLIIANGQWGAFFHGTWPGGDKESKVGIIYAGKNASGKICHFLISWHCQQTRNKVYVETRDPGHYNDNATWNTLENLLSERDLVHHEIANGCYVLASIGDSTVLAAFEGIITLAD